MTLFNVLILSSCFVLVANSASALIITEVQISGDQIDQDYVKIYNPGEELDVSGFQLKKKSSTGNEYSLRSFPRETFIEKESYLIWANSKNNFNELTGATLSSKATLSENNSIALFDPLGNIVSALAWGEGQNPFIEGSVAVRNPEKNQLIKRRKIDNEYQSTQSNQNDFYLTGENLSGAEFSIKDKPLFRYPSRSIIDLILAATIIGITSVKIISIYLKNNFKQT